MNKKWMIAALAAMLLVLAMIAAFAAAQDKQEGTAAQPQALPFIPVSFAWHNCCKRSSRPD